MTTGNFSPWTSRLAYVDFPDIELEGHGCDFIYYIAPSRLWRPISSEYITPHVLSSSIRLRMLQWKAVHYPMERPLDHQLHAVPILPSMC